MYKLKLKDVINIAAPHTWPGSVAPATVGLAISYTIQGTLDLVMALCLYAIVILMQSAVNTFDDYSDFAKGTDTLENSPDAYDAVIVYGMSPKWALALGFIFLFIALFPAIYVVKVCGCTPLIIGAVGTVVLFWYAFGKWSISYLPLGELFCGFVMGGLIPLAAVYLQTKQLYWFVLVQAIPPILGMAVNMFSNNGCDIARDIPAGRKTLACLLGVERSARLYRIMLVIWVLSPVVLFIVQSMWTSVLVYICACLAFTHLIKRQLSLDLGPETRESIMTGATTLVSLIGFSYSIAMVLGC